MLINEIYQKSVIFVTIGILKILVLNMSLIFIMKKIKKEDMEKNRYLNMSEEKKKKTKRISKTLS